MVELRAIEDAKMSQSFAGDLYNSAVYFKRCFPEIEASMVTAIGRDNLSQKMLSCFKNEKLNTEFVFQHDTKVPGLYLIETDEDGERSFTYWRSDAAARKVVDFLDADVLSQLALGDMLFLSGISLAVIEECARVTFWQKLQQIKDAGVKIVFDPNYRSRLWRDQEQAKEQFNKAFALSDAALPGVEDFSELYGINSANEVVDFCRSFDVSEIVVKNGPESVLTFASDSLMSHTVTPVSNVVDTTSAGDAFNGVYLGARLTDRSISDAVRLASVAASTVIQHRGAIAPRTAFNQAMVVAGL